MTKAALLLTAGDHHLLLLCLPLHLWEMAEWYDDLTGELYGRFVCPHCHSLALNLTLTPIWDSWTT